MEWQEESQNKGTREVRVEADISNKKKDRLKQVDTFKYLGLMRTVAAKK